MRWLISSSLRLRWQVLFLAVVVAAIGVVQLGGAQIDVFPEFAPPQVEIQTAAVGNSSQEVEELITAPLEQQLGGIDGVDDMRSKSVSDLSSITLIFGRGTNQERARQLVAERVAQVVPTLPSWAQIPEIIPPVSSTSRVMMIGLRSTEHTQMTLSRVSYWTIRQRLLRVSGVAQVSIWGEQLQQLHVLVDPAKLTANQVTLQEVMDSTGDALDSQVLKYTGGAVIGTGGFVENNAVRLSVRSLDPDMDAAKLARIPVVRGNGATAPVVHLGDVGTVETTYPPMWGNAVVDGQSGVLLVVQKFPGANTLQVTRGIDQALDELKPGLPGITIDRQIFRPASFIQVAIDNLATSLLIGIGLVVLILVAFLMQWRTALISLVSIPLSLVVAASILMSAGITMNVMVIAGFAVAVGVVVDDAIVDTENIVRRLRQNRGERSFRTLFTTVVEGSLEVRSAIIFATVIDVVTIVPVFFLTGLSGAFFRPLVTSYGLAVLASMVVATTVTPAMCLLLLRRPLPTRDPWLLRHLKRGYQKVVGLTMRSLAPALAIVLVALALGAVVVPTLGTSLFPSFKERDFLIIWVTKPGTSMAEETRVVQAGCRDILKVPGVRTCGAHIGQALLADEIFGVSNGEAWVSIAPDADYDKTVAAIQKVVDHYPGAYREMNTYLRERISEVLTGTSQSVVVRISGPDLGVLNTTAATVLDRVGDVPGLVDAHVSIQENVPHIEVQVNGAKAAAVGLKPGDVRRQAAAMIASEEVGDLFQGGRIYGVHVWSLPQFHDSVTALRTMVIDTPNRTQVRLSDVADVRIAPTPSAITREQSSRYIDVAGDLGPGRDLSAVVAEVQSRLGALPLPNGVHIQVQGEADELALAARTMAIYGAAAAVVVLLLLATAYGSFRLAVLQFLTLPMALAGGVAGAWMAGGIVSLGSLVGFLTVFGIAARNGILLISHFQHLERVEGVPFGPELVLRGATDRLAPILMTASATGLALIPLVVQGSIAGHEIEYPMAVVILGGLVTSTLLNLFVLPVLYLRVGRRSPRPRRGLRVAEDQRPDTRLAHMQLTHLGHSAVLVEMAGKRLLIDPGNFSDAWHGLTGLDAILVTHQHPDHVDPEHAPALIEANPQARVLVEPSVVEAVHLPRAEALPAGSSVDLGGVHIKAVGGNHAVIHADIPRIGNVGLVISADGEPTLFHPGDMLDTIPEGIDVLAVPAYGPWAAMKETVDFVRAVGAPQGFIIHEALLSERGYQLVFNRVNAMTKTRLDEHRGGVPWTVTAS